MKRRWEIAGYPTRLARGLGTIAGLGPLHRFESSRSVVVAGVTVQIPNSGTAGGSLLQSAGVLGPPAPSASWATSAPVLAFAGTQRMTSDAATATFTYMHDGSPMTWFMVARVDVAGMSMIAGTFQAVVPQIGAHIANAVNGTVGRMLVVNGSAVAIGVVVSGASAANRPRCVSAFSSVAGAPDISVGMTGAAPGSGDLTGIPSGAPPTFPMMIPSPPVFANQVGELAEICAFDRLLTPAEVGIVSAEYLLRYGVSV